MENRAFAFVATILILTSSACQHQKSSPAGWSPESVVGLHIKLIHPTRVENYYFFEQEVSGEAYVSATLGVKDGAFTGPVLEWRIVDERLWIGSETWSTEFVFLSRTQDRLIFENRKRSVLEFEIISQ